MRLSHPTTRPRHTIGDHPGHRNKRKAHLCALVMLLATCVLPTGALASRQPAGSGTGLGVGTSGPLVTGVDFTLRGPQLAGDPSQIKERSLGDNLTIPAGKTEAVF